MRIYARFAEMMTEKAGWAAPNTFMLTALVSVTPKSSNSSSFLPSLTTILIVDCIMGVARIFQRGSHTDSYIGYSPNCHLNIVGCLLTKRLTKGGSRAPQDPPGYALGLHYELATD